MKSLMHRHMNEDGSAMVVALLILVLLSIIGVSTTKKSEMEVQIAGNQKSSKVAFLVADSGVYATPKLISLCMESDAEETVTGITYLGSSGSFYRELMGFDDGDSDCDINFDVGGFDVDVDVQRAGTEMLPGGGVEFASGAEGPGVGSTGGVAVLYDLDSFGDGPGDSHSNVGGVYRKVVGTPGGL
jgi:hypothetical protein